LVLGGDGYKISFPSLSKRRLCERPQTRHRLAIDLGRDPHHLLASYPPAHCAPVLYWSSLDNGLGASGDAVATAATTREVKEKARYRATANCFTAKGTTARNRHFPLPVDGSNCSFDTSREMLMRSMVP